MMTSDVVLMDLWCSNSVLTACSIQAPIVHVLRVKRETVQEDCEFTSEHDFILTVQSQSQNLPHVLHWSAQRHIK